MPNLTEINNNCLSLIDQHLLDNNSDGKFEACKIYTKLVDEDSDEHNCMGCQFMELHEEIYHNFSNIDPSNLSSEFYFKTYIFWLYQNVERIYEVFEILNPDNKNAILRRFFEKNFIATKTIKRWTNFIKHPKAFKFTHHPKYQFKSEIINPKEFVLLGTEEINEYYSGTSKNRELYKKIAKKDNVIVVLPDLEELTEDFCYEFKIFTSFICENELIAAALKEETTISDYYERDDIA